MNIPQLPADKAGHYIDGGWVFLAVYVPLHYFFRIPGAKHAGLAAAMGVGFLKEASDYLINRRLIKAGSPPTHGVEGLDFLATSMGGFQFWVVLP